MVRKKIAILGGGSAGWLTALFLKKNWDNLEIAVIEDPNSQPIIAGESCTVPFINLLEFLNVPIPEWTNEVGAFPKLGGKFVNWSGDHSFFTQPLFSRYLNRYNCNYPEFGNKNDLIAGCLALNLSVSDLSVSTKLIKDKKTPFINNETAVVSPMWHFDSRKNAAYLKKLGVSQGIGLIEKKFVNANLKNSGSIKSLILEDNTELTSDWFFDCSGFAQLLLKNTLNQQFEDCKSEMPVHSVIAWWDESSELPYTEMTALKAGWSFDVSLHHRSGRGYVYNNSYITADQAVDEINQTFKKNITPVASMSWDPSLSLHPWEKNVIGIGLSTGFLEPLGSPGHTLIGLQLKLLSEYWNPKLSEDSNAKFLHNEKYQDIITDVKDFINLHYVTSRKDSNFWLDMQSRTLSDSLNAKILNWKLGVFSDDFPVYSFENYAVVLQGNKIINFDFLKEQLCYKRKNLLESVFREYSQLMIEAELITRQCSYLSNWRSND
jgi:tryptophan halogenase